MRDKYHYETYRYYKDFGKERIQSLHDLKNHTKKSILAGGVYRDSIYQAIRKTKAVKAWVRCQCNNLIRIEIIDNPCRDNINLH